MNLEKNKKFYNLIDDMEKKFMNLTLERAKELNKDMVTEDSLIIHSLNVCYAMGAMAEHFGADKEHWMAVGYLHD